MATRRPRAPLEAGAVETTQTEVIHVPESQAAGDIVQFPEQTPPKVEAELSGSEVAELRLRNEIVDKAIEEARAAQEEHTRRVRIAQLLQNELTHTIRDLIHKYELDEGYAYRADLERGKLVQDRR